MDETVVTVGGFIKPSENRALKLGGGVPVKVCGPTEQVLAAEI